MKTLGQKFANVQNEIDFQGIKIKCTLTNKEILTVNFFFYYYYLRTVKKVLKGLVHLGLIFCILYETIHSPYIHVPDTKQKHEVYLFEPESIAY